MEKAASEMEYERAAEIRDQIRYVEVTVERQKIISNDNTPRDLFAFYMDKAGFRFKSFSFGKRV